MQVAAHVTQQLHSASGAPVSGSCCSVSCTHLSSSPPWQWVGLLQLLSWFPVYSFYMSQE